MIYNQILIAYDIPMFPYNMHNTGTDPKIHYDTGTMFSRYLMILKL